MNDWQQVQQLFLEAVDLPLEERTRFLERCCANNPELLGDIESLLEADSDSGESIEMAVQSEGVSLLDNHVLIGERLGMYRIVREIGRGGMGSVYLALRDDQEYHKEVALKIVKRGMDTAEVLERFRYERQILANLDHPYIARLFDGGSTADAVPFFVMEYIEGKPVSVFCRENGLDLRARCELFIRILEAVAYAHRSLVVHRDLKPANILITAEGTPKLLDFGVAKLLSGDMDDRTLTPNLRPFTPGYASPEQVRGLPITTSTDIYSLGAILYELLIGKPAQPIESNSPSEIERVVCDTEVPRPSLSLHGIPSDLDNIVLMATRKQPDRRYQSAVQFAEDIRRHLDGRPVIARQDSLGYRASKFILRNRLQAAAASVVATSLIAGLGISLVQTHRANAARANAEAERQIALQQTSRAEAAGRSELQQKMVADQQRLLASAQRDEAEQQRAIAEQRVKEILDLAGSALFDVHDAIAKLPGSLSARRTIVKTALQYLEGLEKQAGMDDSMRQVLCAAYYKIAMIQGDPQGASLQDFQSAETSLLKGESLLMPAYNRNPNDATLMMRLIETRASLAELRYRSGRRNEGIKTYLDLIPVAHRLSLSLDKGCHLECKTQEPALENSLTYEVMASDPEQALNHANRGITLEHTLLAQNPNEPVLIQGLGSLMAGGAGAYRMLGDLEKAGEYYRASIAAREELLRKDPSNNLVRRSLMINYGNYTTLLGNPWSPNLGRPAEARIYGAKCVALAREIAAADPNDVTARHDLGMSLNRLATIDPGPNGTAESLAQLEESSSLIEPIVKANPQSAEPADQLALDLEYEGHRLESLGRKADAEAAYLKSMAVIQSFMDARNSTVLSQYLATEQSLALFHAVNGDKTSALNLANHSLSAAESYSDQSPRTDIQTLNLAKAWSTLGVVQSKLGMAEEARQSAVKALQLWDEIKKPGLLLPFRQTVADTQALLNSPHIQ
ncbi:MAG TPA: protein kinase [Acidobacteriaceae bacterium]|jgi:tetratricopeptide (TPR) repeat protein